MARCDYRVWIHGAPIVGSSALCIGGHGDKPTLVSQQELEYIVAQYGRDNVAWESDDLCG